MKINEQKLSGSYLKGAFIEENNISFIRRDGDDYVLRMDGDEKHFNAYGTYHGGVLFTLADTAAGLLLIDDNNNSVTLQASVNFLRNTKGGPIFTHTRYLHKGLKTNVIQVEVVTEKEEILFSGTFTFYKVRSLNTK